MAFVTGEAAMGLSQSEGNVGVGKTLPGAAPGPFVDEGKPHTVVFPVAGGARQRLVLQQVGMITSAGLQLSGDLAMTPVASGGDSLGGVAFLTGRDERRPSHFLVRRRHLSRGGPIQPQIPDDGG